MDLLVLHGKKMVKPIKITIFSTGFCSPPVAGFHRHVTGTLPVRPWPFVQLHCGLHCKVAVEIWADVLSILKWNDRGFIGIS